MCLAVKVGRMLVDVAIGRAGERGYGEVLIDRLGSMGAAEVGDGVLSVGVVV